jgi:hypothetical protein
MKKAGVQELQNECGFSPRDFSYGLIAIQVANDHLHSKALAPATPELL